MKWNAPPGTPREAPRKFVVDGCPRLTPTADYGGGMYNYYSSPSLAGCKFLDNSSQYFGGGMYNFDGSSPTLDGCVFTGNATGEYGGGISTVPSESPLFTNCRMWCNVPTSSYGPYTDGGGNCIRDECIECSDPNEDDDGDGVRNEDDLCPGGDDLIDSDLDGSPDYCDGCPEDGKKTDPGECGCGIADTDTDGDGTPDCMECTGDLDGSGEVNASDLGLLIALWNSDGSVLAGSDVNADGIVGAADLGLLIGAWGPCQ